MPTDPLEAIRRPVEAEFSDYTRLMSQQLTTPNPLLSQVLSHVSAHSGKQLRPLLVLLAAKACGHAGGRARMAAAAFEMLHNASLLHDDVVDDSPLRRGHPTANAQWGNRVAILAGDYLLAHAIRTGTQAGLADIVTQMAETGCSLADGELLQLEQARQAHTGLNDYMHIIGCKTARLFAACTASGALAADAAADTVSSLSQYGFGLGICFQIKDDLLDYAPTRQTGKPRMADAAEGKMTLPLIMALQNAPERQAQEVLALIRSDRTTDEELREIEQFVRAHRGIEAAGQVMSDQADTTARHLDTLPTSDATDALRQMLRYATQRDR